MHNSKLLQLFQTLDKNELRALKSWTQTGFHNQHPDVEKLYAFLFSRRGDSPLVYSKERAFRYIYGDAPYNDLRLRHIMSLALDCLNEFVRYNATVLQSISTDILLARELHQRKLGKAAKQKLLETKEKLQNNPQRSGEYYLHAFQLEAEQMQQVGTTERVGTNNLQAITNNLQLFFIINTLRYACVHLSHLNLRQSDLKIAFLDAICQEIEGGNYQDCPAAMIYYNIYKALLHPEQETHFQQIKYYLLNYLQHFPAQEYNNLFLQAVNYCIKKLNIGSQAYIREAFELYRYGLEKKVLFDGDTISPFTYKNAVALGLRLGELDWAAQFIPEYVQYLQPAYRSTYLQYNQARLFFAQGDYKSAMRLLIQIEYDDIFMSMDAKVLLLKMYYEQQSFDALESLLQSFYVALQRKKIMGYHRDHYKNIIAFTKKILALPPKDEAAKQALKMQIEGAERLAEKDWLLKMLLR